MARSTLATGPPAAIDQSKIALSIVDVDFATQVSTVYGLKRYLLSAGYSLL